MNVIMMIGAPLALELYFGLFFFPLHRTFQFFVFSGEIAVAPVAFGKSATTSLARNVWVSFF